MGKYHSKSPGEDIIFGVINPIISPINYIELDNFVNRKKIQDYLPKEKEESKDQAFKNLKKFEFRELKKIFDENYNDYITNLQRERIIIIWEKNLIEEIIENENSSIVYKKKIIDEILSIKNNDNRYQINHLKILLVGRKGVGKTTLINYMLNLDEKNKNNLNNNFTAYENKNVPYLKLVEFRGFGLDKNCDPEKVGEEALNYIQNEINNNKNGDYNNFFHCIWYCISGTRFEESEKSLLLKLSRAYDDKKIQIPIIIVYTQNIDNIISNAMIKFIQDIGLKISFIKVLAKDMNLMFSGKIRKAYGRDELLNETLRKCTMTLQGDFINFMIDIISDDIKGKILEKNKSLEKEINYKIINNFINDYKCVLNEEEFKNYITEMIGKGLFTFYENYNKKISNKSLNFLKNSNIINSVNNCIIKYKQVVDQIINDNLNQKAQIFLDQQAAIEKNKFNIRLENKRYLKGFEESIKSFIKRNFYFISQKIIISYIIKNFCYEYIMKYREKLDIKIEEYLEKENRDKEINDYLKDCFLSKLEKFSKKYKIDIKIIHPQLIDSFKEIQDTENFDKGNEDINSIKTFDDFEYGQENQINNVENKNGDHWLPFARDKFKYLNEKSLTLLKDFMENKMEYQDIYFKYDNSEKVFAALKIYEQNDLINFFNSQKNTFIKYIINKTYNNNITIKNDFSFKKSISSSNQFKNVYINKINNEIEKINKEETICKIEYLSIIVIGPSGVGKSTLINGMLNEELAKTGTPGIVTKENKPYKSKNMPFLKLIDTRGIELNIENGPDNILKNALDYINKEKCKIENENKNNYSDYIHCIWYCISNNGISEKEIEILQKLKKENSIPIILVYTNALNEEIYRTANLKIKDTFKDIKLIAVRAKKVEDDIDTFGLNDLLNETLNVCKNNVKGNLYENIRKICFSKITDIFKKRNELIKININNEIINEFIKFNKVLNDEDLLVYIFSLLENIFISYVKEDQKCNLENNDLLYKITNIIEQFLPNFIRLYKNTSSFIVNQIKDIKAIEFLDEQVRKEKKEFKRNINYKNKCDKNDFINIIETFLNNNFYYLSQKYAIYRVIADAFEQISEKLETFINDLISKLIDKTNHNDLLKTIYFKKCEDLKGRIDNFLENNQIYQKKNIKSDEVNYNTRISISDCNTLIGLPAPVAPNS